MSLSIILYIYLGLVGIFLLYNIFVIFLVLKFRFVGPLVRIFIPLYLIGIFFILLLTYGSLRAIDWKENLYFSSFIFW